MQLCSRKIFLCSLSLVCLLFFSQVSTWAQRGPTFSIDYQGPTGGGPGPLNGTKDSFVGIEIDEGSILTTGFPLGAPPAPNPTSPGPLPAPGVLIGSVPGSGAPFGDLNLFPGCKGAVEVDALSYGRDAGWKLFFSVDEFAVGDAVFGAGAPSTPPDVFSEGGFGNSEASADVFKFNGPAVSTIMASPGLDSKAVLDGDGLAPPGLPGVGLVEPNWFNWGNPADYGDNLDAVDMNTRTGHLLGPIFYSLDSYFPDTFEIGLGGDPNAGTAMGNVDVTTGINFSGGDVLVKTATVGPTLYASAASLGLDKFGYDTDDLDALALLDDGKLDTLGNPYFTPGNDRLLFSVRRDSAVIGTLDGLHGISIEPGDILLPPTNPLGQPGIFITAEALGLATIRSGTTGGQNAGDDLNALDVVGVPCDLNFDTLCDVADIDSLYSAGNLGPGVVLPGPPADYDLDVDLDVDNDDLTAWLSEAATYNGFATSYRRGDTELDRDVDLTDFLNLAGNFDPAGAAGPHPWAHGNFDGDLDVDLADFNSLATNFAAAGYTPQTNSAVPEPSAMLLALLATCGAQLCLRRRN